MKIPTFYVSITGYLLHLNNIYWQNINSQHLMLGYPVSATFQLTMLEYCVSITYPSNRVKMEEIANI